MLRPITADPRAELINWEILNLDVFPAIDEWTEEHWEDAALATLVHYYIEQADEGREERLIPFEEIVTKYGFTQDDLEAVAELHRLDLVE